MLISLYLILYQDTNVSYQMWILCIITLAVSCLNLRLRSCSCCFIIRCVFQVVLKLLIHLGPSLCLYDSRDKSLQEMFCNAISLSSGNSINTAWKGWPHSHISVNIHLCSSGTRSFVSTNDTPAWKWVKCDSVPPARRRKWIDRTHTCVTLPCFIGRFSNSF